MNFATEKELEQLRREFPAGCRVVLDGMDDPYRGMPAGMQGTCKGVDDAGNVLMIWDNGSSLSIAFGADTCHRVESLDHLGKARQRGTRCPRCGVKEAHGRRLLALSRRADITVCERCRTAEPLEDAGMQERMPLTDWAVVKAGWKE